MIYSYVLKFICIHADLLVMAARRKQVPRKSEKNGYMKKKYNEELVDDVDEVDDATGGDVNLMSQNDMPKRNKELEKLVDDGDEMDEEDEANEVNQDADIKDTKSDANSSQTTRTRRGRTHLHCLTIQRHLGIKKTVRFNHDGQPIGDVATQMQSYIGVLARDKVKITYDSWDDVPPEIKEQIWEAVNVSNNIVYLVY